MSQTATQNALRRHFMDRWAVLRPLVPVIHSNAPAGSIKPDQAYVRLSFRPTSERQGALGIHDVLMFSRGIVFVQIFVPVGKGTELLNQLADDAASVFRNLRISEPSIKCQGTEYDLYGASKDDTHYLMNVKTNYEAEFYA